VHTRTIVDSLGAFRPIEMVLVLWIVGRNDSFLPMIPSNDPFGLFFFVKLNQKAIDQVTDLVSSTTVR
jgi:hypothetical protein